LDNMVGKIEKRINAITIDVEDVHSIVMRKWFGKEVLPSSAVVTETEFILDILSKFNVQATFFVLGEIVETYPQLIKKIALNNHELGVHGYKHFLVNTLKPEEFRNEIVTTKKMIEDLTGKKVYGHRAPAFSMVLDMTWAFEVLAEAGFVYDSSVRPTNIRRGSDNFGVIKPFEILTSSGRVWEISPAALFFAGRYWNVGGGGYLRQFPYSLNRWALNKVNRKAPAVAYMHPYEFFKSSAVSCGHDWPIRKKSYFYFKQFLHTRNRDTMESKLKRLLTDFKFDKMVSVYKEYLGKL